MGIGVGRLVETAEDGVYSGRQSGRGVAVIEEDAGCRVVQVQDFQAKDNGWKSWPGVRAGGFGFG